MLRRYVTTLFFLATCCGQHRPGVQDDFLQTLKDFVASLNATESQLEAAKQYQEKTFTRMENLNKDLEKTEMRLQNVYKDLDRTERHLEKLLEKMEMKFSTKMESVEKELKTQMQDALTGGLLKVVDGQEELVQLMKNLSKNTQMLKMEGTLKQELGEFVDHIANNQSEATADRLSDCDINMNPVGCHRLRNEGVMLDGKYRLLMEKQNASFCVYCDMTEDGGGWTVIMRRGQYGENRTSFYRKWDQYRNGFGNLEQEFWLGNEKIHALTSTGEFELSVTLTAFDGDVLRVTYDSFTVESEERDYRLGIKDANTSTLVKSLLHHDGMPFSTWDRDNDKSTNTNCASDYKGGWWMNSCFNVLLMGEADTRYGISWKGWKNYATLKGAEMKIRPRDFR